VRDNNVVVVQAQTVASQAEKKQRAFDKTIDEWKRKVADLQRELEASNQEGRNNAAEVYKLRTQLEEAKDTVDAIRRENKNLSGWFICTK
jgi:myosin heavy chain 6/7